MSDEAKRAPAVDDGEQLMEVPSASLTTTFSRQVFPVLMTSILYVISSPIPATRSTPFSKVAPSSERKRRRRRKEQKSVFCTGMGERASIALVRKNPQRYHL